MDSTAGRRQRAYDEGINKSMPAVARIAEGAGFLAAAALLPGPFAAVLVYKTVETLRRREKNIENRLK